MRSSFEQPEAKPLRRRRSPDQIAADQVQIDKLLPVAFRMLQKSLAYEQQVPFTRVNFESATIAALDNAHLEGAARTRLYGQLMTKLEREAPKWQTENADINFAEAQERNADAKEHEQLLGLEEAE